jgi:hypothetical protein
MSNAPQNTCYVCGKPATSVEHVPPRSFFPKEHRTSLITVPSCNEHNQIKSKDDEYIRSILLKIAQSPASELVKKQERALERALEKFLEEFKKALDSNPSLRNNIKLEQAMLNLGKEEISLEERLNALYVAASITNAKLGVFSAFFKEPENAIWHNGQPTISTAIDVERLFHFFELLSQGLWYAKFKNATKKPKYLVFHELLLPDISDTEKKLSEIYRRSFDKSTSSGENKEIFYYEFFHHAEYNTIVLNMCFFEEVIITAVFDIAEQVNQNIKF